jgi:hypothetical protein
MIITLTSTAPSAADLSHLLRKHPGRAQSFDLAVGRAHVFYPEVSDARCTVALMLEADPVGLVRDKRFRGGGSGLAQYMDDRPYASSSMLAVALGHVFRTAMGGRSESFPELAAGALPLTVTVAALPARGGQELVRDLFAPLGWRVEAAPVPLDPDFPGWGDSVYVDLVLTGDVRLADALRHLYVLLPVLDDGKHYWVSDDEVGKLLRAGEGWLAEHPSRDLITRRYLAHQRDLVGEAGGLLDAIVLMEVIEHVDPERHVALEASVFGAAAPRAVIVTTPNREHNALYPGLADGGYRHPDHRFEWTRAEFAAWAERVADRFSYRVEIRPVGDEDPVHGSPTQLALFRKAVTS